MGEQGLNCISWQISCRSWRCTVYWIFRKTHHFSKYLPGKHNFCAPSHIFIRNIVHAACQSACSSLSLLGSLPRLVMSFPWMAIPIQNSDVQLAHFVIDLLTCWLAGKEKFRFSDMKKSLIQLPEYKECGIYMSLKWTKPHICPSLDIGKLLCKIQEIITEAQNINSTTDTNKNMYYRGTRCHLFTQLSLQFDSPRFS